jgi:hypothetical protein
MPEQVHDGIWIRWLAGTWEADGAWATSIQENTLHKASLTKALFILDDHRCVFVPMEEIRQLLSAKPANDRGTIVFRVNPKSATVNGLKVRMDAVESRTYRRAH